MTSHGLRRKEVHGPNLVLFEDLDDVGGSDKEVEPVVNLAKASSTMAQVQ